MILHPFQMILAMLIYKLKVNKVLEDHIYSLYIIHFSFLCPVELEAVVEIIIF